MRMRILLADDESRVRYALRVLLERQAGLQVMGEAADVPELLSQAQQARPGLVLLDWELPGLVPKDTLGALHGIRSDLRVIVLSGRSEARRAALAAGADAFVSKSDPPEKLLAAIDACAAK